MAVFLTGSESSAQNINAAIDMYLVSGALRTVTFGEAIRETTPTSQTRLRVDGTILCVDHDAVWLTCDGVNADRVVIGTGGQVHATGGVGVRMDGAGARFVNDGQVSGDTGAVIGYGIFSVVENRGVLSGTAPGGAGLECALGMSFVEVSNAGTISGTNGLVVRESYAHVVNSGTIRAAEGNGNAIDLGDASASCVIRNLGVVEAPITAIRDGAGDDLVVNIGQIIGDVVFSAGNDTYRGPGLIEGAVYGGSGNDILAGGAGDELLYGGTGNDRLRGNAGDDELRGGNGTDNLRGDTGDDLLYGGIGADSFAFRRGDGDDRIADFANGEDRIDLRNFALASFAVVAAKAFDRPGGLLIDLDSFGGDSVVVAGLTKAQFDAGDLIL